MITAYAKNGGSEDKMWESIAVTEEAMNFIKEKDPQKFDCLMRKQHEILYGKHYDEEMAHAEVEKIHYLDQAGDEHHGANWTVEQIEAATKDKVFPKSATKWDKYVAYNTTYADLMTRFTDEQILMAAYLTWFDDKDWGKDGKIWSVMSLK